MERIGEIINHQERSPNSTQTPKIYEEIELSGDERREQHLAMAGVSDLSHTFENMRKPTGFEGAYQAFKELAEGKADYYMLLVYGGTGNGKTMCCEATVIKLYDRHLFVKRDRWADIVRHLKELMKTGGYESYFNTVRSRRLLILDDVGSGSTLGNWEWGELEDIVDWRLEKKLFTIITTNQDGKDIPPRILSRFKDKQKARLIKNGATDQRTMSDR